MITRSFSLYNGVVAWEFLWNSLLISFMFQVSIPAWFAVDTRLGSLSVHLDTTQCFSAEMYSADLNIVGKPEDDKVKLLYTYELGKCLEKWPLLILMWVRES